MKNYFSKPLYICLPICNLVIKWLSVQKKLALRKKDAEM